MTHLLAALLVTAAQAEIPLVEWDAGNDNLSIHDEGPLARTWGWSCDDPSDQFPLNQRCQVYDTTAGLIGSGNEILLDDADCGTANTDPTTVSYTYDVSAPVGAHWYSYSAFCEDDAGYTKRRNWHTVYDGAPPVATIRGTPSLAGPNTSPLFDFTCDDDVFDVDWDRYGNTYRPMCSLFCKLLDDNGGIAVTRRACDVSLVGDDTTVASHTFSNLDPGTYTFELTPRDGVGQEGNTETFTFTITGSADTDADTDATDDSDVVTDTDATDSPADTDATSDTDTTSDTDDTDVVVDDTDKGDCACAQGSPSGWGWMLGLGAVLLRRRRR